MPNIDLIRAEKRHAKEKDDELIRLYEAFAIVLTADIGLSKDQIQELFDLTQDVWSDVTLSNADMHEICVRDTGLRIGFDKDRLRRN